MAVIIARIVLLAALVAAAPAAAAAPKVGEPAPDFRVTLLDGSKITLAELKGQVVVLNFWATWCVPCKAELPLLNGFFRLKQAHGLRVFAVTVETSAPLYQLRPLAAALTIPLVRSLRGPYAAIDGAVPTNFVIDRAGVVRYAKAAAFNLDDLNNILIPLLREPDPTAVAAAVP